MRIVCLGDSNTYGYDPGSYFGGRYDASSRWVDILGESMGHELINCGQNGASIPAGDYAVSVTSNWIKSYRPFDMLIIMLGSNDLLMGVLPEQCAGRMEKLIRALPMEPERVLLIAPPRMKMGEWVTDPELPEISAALAVEYERLSKRLGCGFADSGEWNVALSYDGVHFTAQGHRSFALGLEKALG